MGKSTLMKVLLPAALVLAGAIGASGSGAASDQRERQLNWDARARYVAGEVIVGFRQQASRADRNRVHGRVPARVKRHFQQLGMEVVKLRPGISVPDAIRSYKQDPAVAFAEPNYLRSLEALPTESLLDLWGL